MKVAFKELPGHARIWIYPNAGPIARGVLQEIQGHLTDFVSTWSAHQQPLKAAYTIPFDRFIILGVDESFLQVSGCSIDASVHFMQQLEKDFDLQLFDRLWFSYEQAGEVHTIHKTEFKQQYQQGTITDETLVFDHLIKTKGELEWNWKKPLNQSWHRRMVTTAIPQ